MKSYFRPGGRFGKGLLRPPGEVMSDQASMTPQLLSMNSPRLVKGMEGGLRLPSNLVGCQCPRSCFLCTSPSSPTGGRMVGWHITFLAQDLSLLFTFLEFFFEMPPSKSPGLNSPNMGPALIRYLQLQLIIRGKVRSRVFD